MSITLTTPFVVNINGVQVENDTVGACTGFSVDYIGGILTYTFQIGTLLNNVLNAGPVGQTQGKTVVVTVNLRTGAWSSSTGGSGTIPGTILNPIITQLLGDRNSSESFLAVPGGLMPGTQVPWVAI